jgi:hypothetical protein
VQQNLGQSGLATVLWTDFQHAGLKKFKEAEIHVKRWDCFPPDSSKNDGTAEPVILIFPDG